MNPNFEEYTLEELEEVESSIDKEQYPERYEIICSLITKIENGSHTPPSKENNISPFNYERLIPKINPKHAPMLKILFVVFSYAWFFTSQLLLSTQPIDTVVYLMFLFAIPVHWAYAYIFNTNMHGRGPTIKPNEYKATRLCVFLASFILGLFISYPRVI
ncbi:hypothetical protein AAD001_18425 [Colwelliaceae bacterium 6471]